MHRIFLLLGTLLAGLSVALGAFGAHGLKKVADADTVGIYQTGVQYQMYHAIGLIIIGILAERMNSSLLNGSGFLFLAGIICFSGSLYLIASMKVMQKTIPMGIGIITPIGGMLFIIGWALLLIAVWRR